MRRSALAFLFCLISTIANAQLTLDKPVFCDSASLILQIIKDRYQERPIWVGSQNKGIIMLTVNQNTKSWTMLEIYDEVACILGTGNQFTAMQWPYSNL
jgi:hypothetical protein